MIAGAFALRFAARQAGLPPLLGFLAAGFVLKAMGYTTGPVISTMAEIGVTLLLFSIGLKLKLETLFKPEVWASTTIHMTLTVLVFGLALFALSVMGLHFLADLDLATSALIAFALSFSSTVFTIKALEEKGETESLHGRVAIGILIMQDVIAVAFITVSQWKAPSLWAFALFALIPLRPLIYKILDRCGHGELLPLFGLGAALVIGAAAFEAVGLKADLGALLIGLLLSRHERANEVCNTLFGFKEVFLIGFFLNIGLTSDISLNAVLIAMVLVLALPFKATLFFALLTRFRLRARSAMITTLSLATYSEFGLIVGSIGVVNGWMSGEWLAIIAIALSLSFVIGAPLNSYAHQLYTRHHKFLQGFESSVRHSDDLPIRIGKATIVILGMGRIGAGAYDAMERQYPGEVVGLDSCIDIVENQKSEGRNVILGDATDTDFWPRVQGDIQLVMITLPDLKPNLEIVNFLSACSFNGTIAAIAQFEDDIEQLRAAGVDAVFDSHAGSGIGFANQVIGQRVAKN